MDPNNFKEAFEVANTLWMRGHDIEIIEKYLLDKGYNKHIVDAVYAEFAAANKKLIKNNAKRYFWFGIGLAISIVVIVAVFFFLLDTTEYNEHHYRSAQSYAYRLSALLGICAAYYFQYWWRHRAQ